MNSAIPAGALVISNGRCGSTLLSNLLAEHEHTLSVQEFFMAVQPEGTTDEVVTGPAYWDLLSSPKTEISMLMRIGATVKEIRYPSTGRWADRLHELPRIQAITLPAISDDPDALFDRLAGLVPDFPTQPLGSHHEMFMRLLTELTGKRRWVERSGGSSHVAPYLLRTYPNAKVVYLTRNRADSAQSMSRHAPFQLIQLRAEFQGRCGYDPFHEPRPEGCVVPEHLERYLPENLTAEVLAERGQDPAPFLMLCAFLSSQAEQSLSDVPPQHLLRISYERLVSDPETELSRCGEFLDLEDYRQWAARVADRVRVPASTRG